MKAKHAVIIGASRGIGQAIAVTLARLGYTNILVGRDADGLAATAAKCIGGPAPVQVAGDVTEKLDDISELIKKHTSAINFLWLGAAGFSEEPLSSTPTQDIRFLIRSGYESQVEVVQALFPLLKAGKAHVVGACSDWSDFRSGGPSVFGSTKVALAGFLDKFRLEASGDGIKVTSLKMGNVGHLAGYQLEEFERQKKETGSQFVSLRDVCDAVEFILDRKTGVVSELTIVPNEGE